jgi:hypothetical protein
MQTSRVAADEPLPALIGRVNPAGRTMGAAPNRKFVGRA